MSDTTLKMLLLAEDRGASKTIDDVGDSAEHSGGKLGKLGETGHAALGKLAGAAAALGAGAIVLDKFSEALDVEAGTSKLTAQLGLTKTESAKAGKVAGNLFSQGYGTGMEQVQEAIGSVIQNIDGMREASDSSLQRVAGKVTNLANIFDQDLGGVTRAVSQMMRTGLAKNADEALDIITKGFQSGVDKSEDFLDTINEYGTQFRKMGISGQMATGLLSQGLKAGARDADIVADAIKEFSLRTQGSLEQTDSKGRVHLTSLGSAFQQVLPKGVDMYKMQENLAKGGAKSREGLDTMLDGLRSIKDPLTRSQVAVQLFGTQAEDMGDALYALDPSKAVAGLGKVAGAADKAGDAFNDNAKAKISTFFRGLEGGAVNILGGKVIPWLEKTWGVLSKNLGPAFKALGDWVNGTVVPALSKLRDNFMKSGGGMDKLKQAFNDAKPFITLVGEVLKAVAGIVLNVLLPVVMKVAEIYLPYLAKQLGAVGKAGIWLWNNALQPAFQFIARGIGAQMELWGRMLSQLGKVPGFGWAAEAGRKMENAGRSALDMADSVKKIPNAKNTDIGTTGLGQSQSAVKSYRQALDSLPAYIRTQIVTQHTTKFDRIDARASGGPVTRGVPYLVGEEGPELIVPDSSGMVVNADGTQRLGSRGGSGGASGGDPGYVVVVVQSEDGRELHRKLLKVKRDNGSLALGLA